MDIDLDTTDKDCGDNRVCKDGQCVQGFVLMNTLNMRHEVPVWPKVEPSRTARRTTTKQEVPTYRKIFNILHSIQFYEIPEDQYASGKTVLEYLLPLDLDTLCNTIKYFGRNPGTILLSVADDLEMVFTIIRIHAPDTLEYRVRQQLDQPKQNITFVPFEEGRGYYV